MATKARPTRATLTSLLPTDQTAGRPVTIGDYIIEQIAAGVHPITAAGAAGVAPTEYLAWVREGQQVIQRLNAGASWEQDFTDEQQDAAVFAQRAIRSHSEQVARLTVMSEQLARGGLKKQATRTRRVNGQVVESVETVETMLPDADMIRWRLEHLEPTVYGKRATLNVTVQDFTDTEAMADVVAERLAAIAAQFAPQAIEATVTE